MERIYRSQLKTDIINLWPECKNNIWIVCSEFWLPSKNQLVHLIRTSQVDKETYRKASFNCTAFAIQLHADIIKRAIAYTRNLPIPFGEVMGRKIDSKLHNHSANICFCQEGVFLIEPQTDKIWEASKENDSIYFVKI